MLVIILALSIIAITYNESFAEKNTFVDSIKFIQYLDENTALEEVRNGNLDMYYYRISSDRLENNAISDKIILICIRSDRIVF